MSTEPTPSSGRATLEQVARIAGVSRATVSRVINGESSVDPRLRELVERAIATTRYVPNRAARSLVTGRTDSVALVVSERERREVSGPFVGRMFTDPYFGRVVTGLLEVLRPRGVQMALMLADDEPSRTQLLSYLHQGHVDGVVLISSHSDDPLPGQLARAALPVVFAGRPVTAAPVTYVDLDQRIGAALAADHLAGLGRRRVGSIAGPQDMPAGQERLAGFQAAMAAHGQPDVPWTEGDFTQGGGIDCMRRLLGDHPDLDGVFVASDLMAQGALTALHRLGRRVPEDVAVVGFDDSISALTCDPPLTTVRQPVEEMAAEMARLLLKQIAVGGERVPSVVFHPTLITRQSA